MSRSIAATALTQEAFAPFGDVIEASNAPSFMINQGRCARHHDLARLDFSNGTAGISVFRSEAVTRPYALELMERHPLGSQAFIPLSARPFLVIVAEDADGPPEKVSAFVTAPGQGVNILRNVWHGVLTPLDAPADFVVVDRIAPEGEAKHANLEEFELITPIEIS